MDKLDGKGTTLIVLIWAMVLSTTALGGEVYVGANASNLGQGGRIGPILGICEKLEFEKHGCSIVFGAEYEEKGGDVSINYLNLATGEYEYSGVGALKLGFCQVYVGTQVFLFKKDDLSVNLFFGGATGVLVEKSLDALSAPDFVESHLGGIGNYDLSYKFGLKIYFKRAVLNVGLENSLVTIEGSPTPPGEPQPLDLEDKQNQSVYLSLGITF